jgi:hypothetical protein
MPKKLSPEEATVMIIRRRLQQMEEAKMADREDAGRRTAANDDDIDLGKTDSSGIRSPGIESTAIESAGIESAVIETNSAGKELPKD